MTFKIQEILVTMATSRLMTEVNWEWQTLIGELSDVLCSDWRMKVTCCGLCVVCVREFGSLTSRLGIERT